MQSGRRALLVCLILLGLVTTGFAQKVNVGYDKSVDFSKYRTYSWEKPEMPPSRAILAQLAMDSIDAELKAKGLIRVEKDGELALFPAGGIGFGSNLVAGVPVVVTYSGPPPSADSSMWIGATFISMTQSGPLVLEGTLLLEFVDRGANKIIWTGRVKQKLDPEQKQKSLNLVDKAITKLLKDFPPKSKTK